MLIYWPLSNVTTDEMSDHDEALICSEVEHPSGDSQSLTREESESPAQQGETMEKLQMKNDEWQATLTDMIQQMMFVSGETAEPSPETTTIIEEIVREQVVEMVSPNRISSMQFRFSNWWHLTTSWPNAIPLFSPLLRS